MVVQCSEDAKTALNHVSFRKSQVVHQFIPLNHFGLYAAQSRRIVKRERSLSLLEKYTLRAFNEIPNVSAVKLLLNSVSKSLN